MLALTLSFESNKDEKGQKDSLFSLLCCEWVTETPVWNETIFEIHLPAIKHNESVILALQIESYLDKSSSPVQEHPL